jgi:DNA polymerase III gamma/tau subunit
MSKVASTMQRLERETKKREALEQTLDQIHVEHNAEYQKILEMHRQELELLREEWEEDKNTLLSMVQSECNLVFDRNKALNRSSVSRSGSRRTSPTNQTIEATSNRRSTKHRTAVASNKTTSSSNEETLLSQINRDLRETENLVKGLVGGVATMQVTER